MEDESKRGKAFVDALLQCIDLFWKKKNLFNVKIHYGR